MLEKTKKTKKKKKMALMREEVAMVVLKGNKARIYRGKIKRNPMKGKKVNFCLACVTVSGKRKRVNDVVKRP